MRKLPALLDQLEEAGGPADPVPSADGWELVLAENMAYLVDDQRRWQALRPCGNWTPTACGYSPGWATATRPPPTPPVTGGPSPGTARAPAIPRLFTEWHRFC